MSVPVIHLDRAGAPALRKATEQVARCLLTPAEPRDPTGWWVSELAKPPVPWTLPLTPSLGLYTP